MELFNLVFKDFLSSESSGGESTFANDLVIKIQSAKLTTALTENELTMVEFIVGRLVNLEQELEGTVQVFLFQYQLITGNTLEIQVNEVPCELPSMMMTTTKSTGFISNEMVQIDVEVCVRGETRAAPWARFGYSSKRRQWLKNAMKNAFKKHF